MSSGTCQTDEAIGLWTPRLESKFDETRAAHLLRLVLTRDHCKMVEGVWVMTDKLLPYELTSS